MRIVCISDTHERDYNPPDGDVLIHAGDITLRGSPHEVYREFIKLNQFPHKYKIFVAGNHDWLFQNNLQMAKSYLGNVIYLEQSGITIDGLSFWGTPWQPDFMFWAFNLPRGQELSEKYAQIPDKLDVLITHSPPYGYGDDVWALNGLDEPEWINVGSKELLNRVLKVKPKFHVFGHVHGGYGEYQGENTYFINASICDERYQPTHKPICFDI